MKRTSQRVVQVQLPGEKKQEDFRKGPDFWLIYLSVSLVCFASALDTTIISTALPTIIDHIPGSPEYYIWIANCLSIAQVAVQPVFGQACNIFGRRWPMLGAMALFLIGAAIAGAANSTATLIVGRTIIGLGSGGIFMMGDLITCDLVPMRYRGKYLGIVLSTAALGSTLGPLVGGAIARRHWRWVFWVNLPIGGVAILLLFAFLKLKFKRTDPILVAIKRLDLPGNALFIASMTSLLFGLIAGGNQWPWSSWHVIVPLAVGVLGWVAFHVQQHFVDEPTVPGRFFKHRTAVVGFFITWVTGILIQWITYFLPVYFQALLRKSPLGSGVALLPLNAFLVPAAMAAGGLMSKFGYYRNLHAVGLALLMISLGLFSILKASSSDAAWVCFQVIAALGLGFPISTTLPSIQACFPESDAALTTATFTFVRSFGYVWGITIPSIIFNNVINSGLESVGDPLLVSQMQQGGAYGFAVGGRIFQQSPEVQERLVSLYTLALQRVWEVGIAFAGVGLLSLAASKHVPLREELDT